MGEPRRCRSAIPLPDLRLFISARVGPPERYETQMEGHDRNIFIPSQARRTAAATSRRPANLYLIEIARCIKTRCSRACAWWIEIEHAVKLNRPTPVTPLLAPFNRSLSLLTFDDLQHPIPPPCNRLVRLVGNDVDDHFERKFLLPSPLRNGDKHSLPFRSRTLAGRFLVFHSLSEREIRNDKL